MKKKYIYFDNAATSWPKPKTVLSAMIDFQKKKAANPGRSGHRMSLEAARVIFEARNKIADFFNVSDPVNIIFTQNATHSLNISILGLLKPGDHVITSGMEHNSVMRPLNAAKKRGVSVTVVKCNADGSSDPADIEKAIQANTKAVYLNVASNVTGSIMPIKEIGITVKNHGLIFCVDAAQAAGVIPIDVKKMNIDFLAFTGHKSLYGPQGTGGFYIGKNIEKFIEPLFSGGTGSKSEFEIHPDFMPDRFEAGTPNGIGIAGLSAGIDYINSKGITEIFEFVKNLTRQFLDGIKENKKIKIYGRDDVCRRMGVVSFNIKNKTPSDVSYLLDEQFSIMSRPGLHCAPSAHKTIGSFPQGAVRFSFSSFNTEKEIDYAVKALNKIAKT